MDSSKMVDLGGYVIILVETHDKKVKLYGKNRKYFVQYSVFQRFKRAKFAYCNLV